MYDSTLQSFHNGSPGISVSTHDVVIRSPDSMFSVAKIYRFLSPPATAAKCADLTWSSMINKTLSTLGSPSRSVLVVSTTLNRFGSPPARLLFQILPEKISVKT